MSGKSALINLKGKNVLLSGGLGALAGPIIEQVTACGARMVINDVIALQRRPDVNGVLGYICADAAIPAAADEIIGQSERLFGDLPDTVCCHAGIVVSKPIINYSLKDMEDVWRTNVLAQFALAQCAAKRWIEARVPGHLIFTSSWVQSVTWPGIAAYSSSKSALKVIAECFARELADHGIRANILAPGIVNAGMAKKQWETEPDYRALAERAIPLGTLQTTKSVADAFTFLISDLANYMTGSTLLVDGGASLYPMQDNALDNSDGRAVNEKKK